jgi:hypothetical protein
VAAYSDLLDLVRQQVAAARAGDVDTAVGLMEHRTQVLAGAPAATASDEPAIREVLTLDKELAGYIRVRMIAIREQAVANGRGQTALRGYGSVPARPPAGVRINSAR